MKLLRYLKKTIIGTALFSPFFMIGTYLILSPAALKASGSPPSVDAGPAKVLVFPAKDLTLFGHATDPERDPLTVVWTQMSGPAPATFSAPKALSTTTTFTITGTYVFQLAVSDGTSNVTSSVTVTVNPASSQTAFYVDPDYTGTGNGSPGNPWNMLGSSGTNPQWTAINSALASGPVIIYFSAREATQDIPDEINGGVYLVRTNTSTNRLTVDGMSKYNVNDVSPSWTDYTGNSKMRIRAQSASLSIGWGSDMPSEHNVTIRGFEVTGSSGRITFKGSHTVLEYVYSHDVTSTGATIQFNGAVTSSCVDLGRDQDITIRNNLVERGIGEGIYVAGNYMRAADGGCPSYGNTHSDILIEGNTIRDPGLNGDQGDGIDLKAGLMNVTVRNNVIKNTHAQFNDARGMVASGVFPGAESNYLIEGNLISDTNVAGMAFAFLNGAIVRNNVVYNNAVSSIDMNGDDTDTVFNIEVKIYNNTVTNGISIGDSDGAVLRNNLVWNGTIGGWSSIDTDSDYNILFAPTRYPEGPHSIFLTETTGLVVDPVNGDFHLVAGSRAIDAGTDLTTTGFATDFDKVARPQGAGWDIGAYEWEN